jgi:energy-coupling factor transport system permease protein
MSVWTEPIVADPSAPITRLNPVAKLAAALVIAVGLLPTGDPVTPALVLTVELLAIAVAGVRWGVFLRRLWLLFVTMAGLCVSTLMFTDDRGGTVLVAAGPLLVTSDSVVTATAMGLRVLAIALPGVLVFASTDPTEFADALVQHLRTPPRFTFGALAAFRLLPVLSDEWRMITLARRARGVDPGRSPLGRARLFASAVFALLVGAIRRGVRLATAMDSRGFTHRPDRTVARPRPFRAVDGALIAASCVVVVGATALSVWLGTWRLVFF